MVNKTLEQLEKRLWRLEAITITSNLEVLMFRDGISVEVIRNNNKCKYVNESMK